MRMRPVIDRPHQSGNQTQYDENFRNIQRAHNRVSLIRIIRSFTLKHGSGQYFTRTHRPFRADRYPASSTQLTT